MTEASFSKRMNCRTNKFKYIWII